ncbi:MAG: hypothetical protein ACRCU2_09275, partial [Planktothrix sp.]
QKKSDFASNSDGYPLKGYYYPVRLNDTYGLLIDCSIEHHQSASGQPKILSPIDCFVNLKGCINEKRNHKSASLGETWMISGEIPNDFREDPEELAKKCYDILMPNADWSNNFQGKGRLFGGFIFELWGMPSMPLSSPPNPLDWHHVVIALYPDETSARQAGNLKIISSWMRLFCYRSKIQWCYIQSRRLKSELKANFVSIYEGITDIKNANLQKRNFTELSKILDKAQKTLSQYSLTLSDFEYQLRTLEVNLYNYQKRLERLEEITELESSLLMQSSGDYLLKSSDLKFLAKFSQWAEDKYLLQLIKDLESLSPGLKLLDGLMNSIASVRSIIEIDQAQRDRSFQNTIAIVGVGAGAASVVASASASFIGAIEELPLIKSYLNYWQISNQQADLVTAINFSLWVGVCVALLTAVVIKFGEFCRKVRKTQKKGGV